MTKEEVRKTVQKELFVLQDLKYRDFHSSLMPGIDKSDIIGIRTPVLRTFAKKFAKTEEAARFMDELPHKYYEENNLQMMLIGEIRTMINVYLNLKSSFRILIIGLPVIFRFQNALLKIRKMFF